ncbi:hypothetical protein SDC9_49540 [bioreactor metagenome]|uniref:SLH domain-containing protein n=1 Tax=bioreactor metagenome TaxID=1076179 RepID=A0A644WHC0_9ZZZZ
MKLKRLTALILVVAALAGLLVVPAYCSDSSVPFRDITDSKVAEAAEILRLLGIVNGVSPGSFNPGSTLTRASFCKMALIASDRGDEAAAQANRVVFPDVTASHWALGYVNAAATAPSTDASPLVRGSGDGKFWPDKSITYAEAVTILMRMLGYTDSSVGAGATWYSGYLSNAKLIGLTDGLTVGGSEVLTRANAALLFSSLLFTEKKDSESLYITVLGGSVTANAVILDTDATADDGTTGSVKTSLDTYVTDRTTFSAELTGTRGKLVLDKDGKLLAVRPQKSDTFKWVSVAGTVDADYITVSGGSKLSVSLDTVVWKDGKATTYERAWTSLKAGTSLVFCYNGSGAIDYIFISDGTTAERAIVAKSKPSGTVNPFASLASGTSGYTMYKNGMTASVSDIAQYDVATYDSAAKVIQISDLRITGLFENAYPNTTAPSTITVLGMSFPILSSAVTDLQSFKIGDSITILLTAGRQVAGVVSPSAARGTAVGLAQVSGTSASVTLLDSSDIVLTGKVNSSDVSLDGRLVSVSSSKVGYLTLSALTGSSTYGSLNVAAGTLGGKALARNVRIFEAVGEGKLSEISLNDITLSSVSAGKIVFVRYDYANRPSIIVLDDVTGDGYQYGYFVFTEAYSKPGDDADSPFDDEDYTATIAVRYGSAAGTESVTETVPCIYTVRSGAPGGLAYTADGKPAGYVELKALRSLTRAAFNSKDMTLSTSDTVYPISDDVQCFNKASNVWLAPGEDGLEAALAFSNNLMVYYDKSPEQGGKIRLIEAY